jgi:hypothetical protein
LFDRPEHEDLTVIAYTIETSLHLMQVRVSDSVRLLDLANFVAEVQKNPLYGPALKTLFLVDTNALLVKIDPGSLSTFFRKVEQSGGSATWAIVVTNESHKSVFSAALQNFVSKRLRLRIFDEELTALQWLKSN